MKYCKRTHDIRTCTRARSCVHTHTHTPKKKKKKKEKNIKKYSIDKKIKAINLYKYDYD